MHTGPMFLIYNFFMVQFVAPFFYSIANIFNIERKSNKFNNIIAYALKFNIPICSENMPGHVIATYTGLTIRELCN